MTSLYKTRSEVPKKEPDSHRFAKYFVCHVAKMRGYNFRMEEKIMPLMYFGKKTQFPIDVFLFNSQTGHKIYVQLDGAVHFATRYQHEKTKMRDKVISKYCESKGITYVVLTTEEVLHYLSRNEIAERLGILYSRNESDNNKNRI